jgi:branched-chain amino acid transport system substrate-binding protein
MGKLKNVRLFIIFAALAISLMLFVPGCEKGVESMPEAGPIKIGLAAPMSGDAAAYGEIISYGALMKIEEINNAGGINGRMLELVIGDERCDPKEAAAVAQNFSSNEEILAVVGHVCSSATLAAIPYYKEAGLPAVSPTATNIEVARSSEWMFRDVYTDDFQGDFLARYAKEVLGAKTVAIFHENNDYAIGLKESFETSAKEIGLEVVGVESFVTGTVDFTPQLSKFKELAPDAIFIGSYYQEGGLILSQAFKLGIETQFLGADGLNNPELINIAKEAAEGFLASSPFVYEAAGGEALKFKAKFEEEYGTTPDWMAANAYDAVGIIAMAIEECGADRTAIKDCLAGMNSKRKGYDGVTGNTFFDENGDCQKPAYVTIVKDGEFIAAEKQMF